MERWLLRLVSAIKYVMNFREIRILYRSAMFNYHYKHMVVENIFNFGEGHASILFEFEIDRFYVFCM